MQPTAIVAFEEGELLQPTVVAFEEGNLLQPTAVAFEEGTYCNLLLLLALEKATYCCCWSR